MDLNQPGYGYGGGHGNRGGYGYGGGHGNRGGYGYGDGHGDGDGYGHGNGDGYGYGNGNGYGYGDGDEIGSIGEYKACSLLPWHYLRIGCEVHSCAHWREHWREIARKHNAAVSEAEILALIEEVEREQTDVR